MLKHCIVTVLVLIGMSPAFAGETAWVEVAPDARIRLVSSDIVTSGKTYAAIEIDMPSFMKTYWRIPGETGIPTQMDTGGSSNITDHEILWPYPRREAKDGYIDFVYYGPTVLPVVLDVDADKATLATNIIMGVCADICVPVRASLELPLDFTKPDRGQDLRIRQAIAQTPLLWENANEPIGDVWFDADTGRLDVAVDTSVVDPATLIVDNGDPVFLLTMPQKSPEAGIISFELLGRGKNEGLHGKAVRLTFLTREGAFELSRIVQPAGTGHKSK